MHEACLHSSDSAILRARMYCLRLGRSATWLERAMTTENDGQSVAVRARASGWLSYHDPARPWV